jgi:DNA polymerase III epsilon subunit-like protein
MFIFLDTETTGNVSDDRLCQIAFKPESGQAVSGLFNPGKPISIDAMVVHHITDKMVQDSGEIRLQARGRHDHKKPPQVETICRLLVH